MEQATTSPDPASSAPPPPECVSAEGLSSRAIVLDGAGAPPTELPIWKLGPVPTLKGVFLYTQKSAALIKAQWALLGRDIGFDFGHEAFKAHLPESAKVASGWGKVDVRADGSFWITQIQWTPEAAAKIANKEIRYLSPAFDADAKTGEILNCKNIALTNFPATLNARPILLSDGEGPPLEGAALGLHLIDLGRAVLAEAQEQAIPPVSVALASAAIPVSPSGAAPLIDSDVDREKLSAGPVPYHAYPTDADTSWDADAAVSELRKWASSDGSGDKDKIDWAKYAQGFTYVRGDK